MAAQKFPFLSTLIRETSADWKPSLLIGLPIQIISLLQLTYVIIQPVSQQYLNIQLSYLDIIQKVSSVTTAFAETGLLDSNGIVELVWALSIIYFLVHVALIIRIFFKSRKLKPRNERFPNFHTILYLLHARIIFFPLHYYFLWFIKTFTENLDDSGGRLSGYGVVGLVITILLAACNIILAIFKEFFSYQIRKSKDALATKNNLNSKTILLHKGIHLVLILFITGDIKEPFITLLNLLISGFCWWDLFFRLSFYNLAILKLNLVFTVCHAVLSLVFALDLINIGNQYSEIILFVILPLTSKIVLKYFNKTITRLSRLEFKTPEEAAHSLVLMKRYLGLETNVMSSLEKSQKALVFQYGMLKLYANDISKAPKEENILEPSQQIYMVFLRKCQALYKRCPSSELLQILMAQTYISKINNTAIGLSFVNKLNFDASIPAQRSVQNIHRKLERVYFRAYLDEEDKLEALRYFENRDYANTLKSSLQNEILEHLKLWKELIHEQVDVKTVLDTAENIEDMAKKVNKIWSDPFKDTQKNFGALFLMYGTFLDIVRGNHHERASMMLKYSSIMKNKDETKRITSPFSEDVAVMLISVEVDKLGRVVDASSSVKNIFKIEKEKLIGQKLDNLMPRNVARVHDYFLEKNNRLGIHSVHRDFDTYAKTISGNFFQIHLDVRVCPSLAKGLNLMGKVKKLRNEELVIMVNQQGILVDCSRDLFETFKITPKDFDRTKIIDLCPDFLAVHHSFNIVYCGEPEINLTCLDDRSSIVPEKDNADTGVEHNLRKLKSQPMKLLSLRSTEDKLKSEDSEAFGSPAGTVSTKKSANPNQLNPGMKFFTKLRLPTFLQEGVVDDPEQKGGNITFPTMITKEKAEEIVERFKTGVKLNFYSLAREKNSKATGEKIEYQVIMEHFILNGEHYKIIKLKNFRVEEKIINFLRGDAALTNFNKAMKETPIQDSLSPMNALLKTKETLTKMKTDENNFEAMRKLTSMRKDEKRKTLAKAIENKGNVPVPSKQEIKPAFQRLFTTGLRSQRHAASSTFSQSSSSSEAQTTKILSKLYQTRSMRPVTTFAVFIVYFSMLVVFVLATIDYFFSNQSITDLQTGMLVVDTANRRLINTIVAWQWVLIVYARSVGIRAIVPSFITGSMGIIRNRTLQMISENAELKMRLEDLNQEEFIKAFFVKDIPLYEPSSGLLFDSDYIDGFTATKVLSTKYFDFSNFTQSVLLLNNTDYVLFVMNNTANGFLLRCEAEITQAESILANITDTNKNLLVVLLVIQILSLAFVLISLLYLVRVVFLSYIRLFRALTRIKEADIFGRISHLETIFNCLNENIESKNFSDKLEECFDDLMYPTKKPSKKAKIKKSGFQEENFTFSSLIIQTVKYLSVSIVLLLALIAIFSVSFTKSTNSFKTLQTLNSQISLAHRLGYAFDMLLPIFYFFIIFQAYPNYLIRNQSPWVQLKNLLPYLAQANNMLLDSLSDPEYGFGDAVLEDFFTRNFCNYVQSSATSNCRLASKGGVMGFSELNTQYYNSHIYWLGVYLEDPNYVHAKTILVPYALEIVNDITIIEDCYRFLADHLLSLFNNETDNKNKESSTMFIIMLLSIFVSTIAIQSITIKKFKKNDLVTKKILKIIPINIIQQNKILGTFLMNEYKGQLHGVRRYLQSS